MTILERLAEGPKRYQDLLDGSREQLDLQLRRLCKARRIILRQTGYYELWPRQPPDNPFMEPLRKSHPCLMCGDPVYRKGGKYCSQACQYKASEKPKPDCLVCGTPVNQTDNKFCSVACRAVGQVRRNGSALKQTCRRCKKEKGINLFPASSRGYSRSLCYKCIREIS